MYLSLLELNPRSRQVQAELRDPYQMHKTLSRAFGDNPETYRQARCLFRVDESRTSNPVALVQSMVRPDLDALAGISGYTSSEPRIKEFTPSFREGQTLRFRLRANPAVRRDGKRVGLYSEDEQVNWLTRKAQACGFELLSLRVIKDVGHADNKQQCAVPGAEKAVFASVIFEGTLQVTDPKAFLETLESGIGSAKGFGFGLLSVALVKG